MLHARSTTPPTTLWMLLYVRDCLLQWTDYVRVLALLEVETETHLLDQVLLCVVTHVAFRKSDLRVE